jgi:hypothetical protein
MHRENIDPELPERLAIRAVIFRRLSNLVTDYARARLLRRERRVLKQMRRWARVLRFWR